MSPIHKQSLRNLMIAGLAIILATAPAFAGRGGGGRSGGGGGSRGGGGGGGFSRGVAAPPAEAAEAHAAVGATVFSAEVVGARAAVGARRERVHLRAEKALPLQARSFDLQPSQLNAQKSNSKTVTPPSSSPSSKSSSKSSPSNRSGTKSAAPKANVQYHADGNPKFKDGGRRHDPLQPTRSEDL